MELRYYFEGTERLAYFWKNPNYAAAVNYAVIVFDLRGLSERTLMKTPSGLWHRLRHAVESSPSAFLVQSTTPLVPAVTWRLLLNQPMPLRLHRTAKADLANAMNVEVARGQIELEEQSA